MIDSLNTENFKSMVLEAQGLILVDFYADWCGPCQELSDTLEALSKELGNDVKIFKLDIDNAGELAAEYKIMAIPTIKIFKDGEVVGELQGLKTKEEIQTTIEGLS